MGIFSKLFGKKEEPKFDQSQMVDLSKPFFRPMDERLTQSNVVREAISSITRHAPKMEMFHYVVDENDRIKKGRRWLNRVLQYRPNPLENAGDFLEKALYHYVSSNNVFIYLHFIEREDDDVVLDSLWVLDPLNVEVRVADDGEVLLSFWINNETKRIITPLDNVAFIKRSVGTDEFFGANNRTVRNVLNLIETNYQGIEKAIKTSAALRFLVRTATPMKEEALKKKAEQFQKQFLDVKNSSGVVFHDTGKEIKQVQAQNMYANFKDSEQLYERVYSYFGTNKNIVNGDFNDTQWNAFYESTLAPFVRKMEIELTRKIFTVREMAHGNRIGISTNMLRKMSIEGRLKVIGQVKDLGLMTINEMRQMLHLDPVEDGDVREVSLNYVDAEQQSQYQTGDNPKNDGDGEDE